ncbi:MFS transporter [Brevibacillus nitrificans]|uniref:MFS transporter n=1 Tax=Brevibacillus nitrificans TaxID=651560 RepID=UPI00285C2AF4|nr:MFS transporter [Brevibacillus nitrificans]MDR7319567.1 putative MFS family arabinose efflux permease [Brevibacillus nitrificans]
MALLKHPVFRRLYAAHIIHIIGNEFTFIAVVGLLHDLSGSGLSFAAGTVFRMVPYVLTSFFSGALVENWDKQRVMITVNLLRGILVSLFFFISSPAYLWVAFLLLIVVNICSAFFQPAMQVAIVSAVAEKDRLTANSLLQGTTSFLIIVCQGVAAVLVYLFSYRYNFLLDAACYMFSLFILLRLPKIVIETNSRLATSFVARLQEGFRYIARKKEIGQVLLYQMAERVLGAYYIMLMYYILQERGEGLYVFGLLDIPLGLGGVFAGIVVTKISDRLGDKGVSAVQGWTLVAMGLSIYAVFHIKPILGLAAAILVCSFASYSASILSVTKLQRLADPDYLARVFSIREMATMGSFSASCLVLGYGAEKVGSAVVSGWLAVFGVIAGLLWLWSRSRLEKQTAEM